MSHAPLAFVALFAAVGPVVATRRLPTTASFHEYAQFFGRTYDHESTDGMMRRSLFEERLGDIRRQNEKSGALWQAGLNEFTDWTHGELLTLRGWRGTKNHGHSKLGLLDEGPAATLPEDFPVSKDWTYLKSLAEPPNQGGCGSCWAVATTYLLRSAYEIKTGEVKNFSMQELVNCVENPNECGGQGGCTGATVELALAYVQNVSLGNLSLTSELPYTGLDSACVKYTPSSFLATGSARSRGGLRGLFHDTSDAITGSAVDISSFQTLSSNDPVQLLQALLNGPVGVAAAAGPWASYTSGVFDGCTDGLDGWVIDHAILMVGFGEDAGTKYWRIMNSWGSSWGEEGFIRLLRKSTEEEVENCGWDMNPAAGIACKPYPEKVQTCGMCGVLYDSVVVSM